MRRILITLAAAAIVLGTRTAEAAGTVRLANGGSYFSAYGPAAYWHYVWGEGYCGKYDPNCGPRHFQWTYVTRSNNSTNGATWTNPYPVNYPSRAYAFIPCRDATAAVEYYLHYNYGSTGVRLVDQMPYCNAWAALNPSTSMLRIDNVRLGDASFWGTGSAKVAFDEIKIEN